MASPPPHPRRIALVGSWTTPEDSRFWMALQRAAQTHAAASDSRIVIHAAVELHADNPAGLALRSEAEAGRLAGVIFAAPPATLVGPSFPRRRELPRVAIMRGPGIGGTPTVYPDETAFFARAADHFARRGRRRVALIGALTDHARLFGDELAARGIASAPWLLQTVPLDQPEAARACAQLLFRCGEGDRPDALLISDDNLVSRATAGVVDVGVDRGIDIVGHCNFPWPTASALPIRRLGYDSDAMLERCLEAIAAQRDGRRVRDVTLRPVFADELAARAIPWDAPDYR